METETSIELISKLITKYGWTMEQTQLWLDRYIESTDLCHRAVDGKLPLKPIELASQVSKFADIVLLQNQ